MAGSHEAEAHRETAGLPRPAPAAGTPESSTGVDTRITALDTLTTADLRIEWRRLYRATPPTRLSRDLLIRGVAYKIQEQEHGGLGHGTRRRLRSLAEGADKRDGSRAVPAIALKPGTKLVREWRGHVHTVNVLNSGFDYQGERFRSLSQIARQITRTHRSGPLFFGLNKRRRAMGTADE
jgi:hypothetical protein